MKHARERLIRFALGACVAWLPLQPASAYQLSDLQGTWQANTIASGPGAPWWERSSAVVAADGSFTAFATDNGGGADTIRSRFDLTPMGILTVAGLDGFRGALDAGTSVFVGTATWESGDPGTTELRVGLKMAPTYVLSDLAGEWEMNAIASGPGAPWWERGRLTVASNGAFVGTLTEQGGGADPVSGTFALTSAGVLSFSGSGNARGVLDAHNTVFALTSTWTGFAAGTVDLSVAVKMAPSYSLADLAGTWQVHGLATGPGAPRWSRNQVLVRNDGSFSSYFIDSQGQTHLSAGTLSISASGIVTRAGAPQARGVLDAGKTVMVWTDTWTTEAPGTSVMEIAVKTSHSTTDVGGTSALDFALLPVQPNPARGGALVVRFVLGDAAPARIELLDVSGRRIAEREVGSLGAGRHALDLGAGRALAPGLYLVRLSRGGDSRVTRAVLLD